MLTTLKRLAFVGLFLLPIMATPASAQTPTPEGTVPSHGPPLPNAQTSP